MSEGIPDPYIAALDDVESVLFLERCPNLAEPGEAERIGVVVEG